MLAFDYVLKYKQGKENIVVDALSWRDHELGEYNHISTLQPQWLQEVIASYEEDTTIQDIMQKVIIHKGTWDTFTLSEGLLRFQGKIYIGKTTNLHQTVIKALHDSPVGDILRSQPLIGG